MFLHHNYWNSKNNPRKDKILNKCQLIILFSQNSLRCLPEWVVSSLVKRVIMWNTDYFFFTTPSKNINYIHKIGVLWWFTFWTILLKISLYIVIVLWLWVQPKNREVATFYWYLKRPSGVLLSKSKV